MDNALKMHTAFNEYTHTCKKSTKNPHVTQKRRVNVNDSSLNDAAVPHS